MKNDLEFGTDGIRGSVSEEGISPEFALKLGLLSERAMSTAERCFESCKMESGHSPPDLHFMST